MTATRTTRRGPTSTRGEARGTRRAKTTATPRTTSSSGCRAGAHGAGWRWTRRPLPCIITTCPRTYATRADRRPTCSRGPRLWSAQARRRRLARRPEGASGMPPWQRHVPPSTPRSRCLRLRLRPLFPSIRHGGISVVRSRHVLRHCARRTPQMHRSPPLPPHPFPRVIHAQISRRWIWWRWTPRWPLPQQR